ncbi:MAG: SurA N-terminal domain-containing protein [Syntrophaceae bacterium]|nr:SurA N-terminal domain-containing protein [Syntrophaceae bacterium]
MLKFFRKHARGWFMIAVIVVIIIVFVLYFGSSGGGRHTSAIFIVDKQIISEAEFLDEYDKLLDVVRINLKEKLTPEILKKMNLKAKAYNNLLNRYIIIAKAADLKIKISDEELKDSIMSLPILQTNGIFDEMKYQQLLRYNRMTAQDFENLQKTKLMAEKIEFFVREGVKISDKEIYDWYVLQNWKININFLKITGGDIKNKISPVESELEDYLKRNNNLFRVPEQTKIKYLFFTPDSFSPDITDDDDIKSHYNSYRDKYKTKDGKPLPLDSARDSIIKELKITRGKQNAYQAAKKARDVIYQEDNMEDYGEKNNLKVYYTDFFPINKLPPELVSVKNVTEELLNLQEKDVSKVISADNGYYLMQLIEKKASYVPKLNIIENEVRRRFIETETKLLAEKEANSILERLKSGESFEKIASEKGLKIGQTGFFQPSNTIPNVGQNPDAEEIILQLSSGKPYAEKPFFINDAYFILKFKEATEPNKKTFADEKEIYRKTLIAFKQKEAMQTWLEGNKAAMIKEKRVRIKKKLEDL